MTTNEQGSCNKGPEIDTLKKHQLQQGSKIDQILLNQTQAKQELKEAIDGLTQIVRSDIETRKDVEQLKKDRDYLYGQARSDGRRIDKVELRNAICDGSGILDRFPKVWDWYMGEKGWRRMIPGLCAVVSVATALWMALK